LAGRQNVGTINEHHRQDLGYSGIPGGRKGHKIGEGSQQRHPSRVVLFFGCGYSFLLVIFHLIRFRNSKLIRNENNDSPSQWGL